MTKILDNVVCVCCKRDADTWKEASKHIVRFIKANKYKVYVPDHELNYFKSITPIAFDVIGESIFTKSFSLEIKKRLPSKIADQFGWYLQQFIKLAAVSACNKNEIVLIWDADTVPLRPLQFIDSDGMLVYYKSDEHHHPYFVTIDKLLGLNKIVDFSFIAQSFVINADWFNEFLAFLELRHQKDWVNALLDNINFNEGNSFSEYETLGAFISNRHKSQIRFSNNKWLRLGNSTIGHIAFLNDRLIAKKLHIYDFVSFEKWDKAKPYYLRVTIPYIFKVYIPSLLKKKVN